VGRSLESAEAAVRKGSLNKLPIGSLLTRRSNSWTSDPRNLARLEVAVSKEL
jgi:hypothetical protein